MLENQIYSIESANINQETLNAMKNAGKAMKDIHGNLTIDKVDAIMFVFPIPIFFPYPIFLPYPPLFPSFPQFPSLSIALEKTTTIEEDAYTQKQGRSHGTKGTGRRNRKRNRQWSSSGRTYR